MRKITGLLSTSTGDSSSSLGAAAPRPALPRICSSAPLFSVFAADLESDATCTWQVPESRALRRCGQSCLHAQSLCHLVFLVGRLWHEHRLSASCRASLWLSRALLVLQAPEPCIDVRPASMQRPHQGGSQSSAPTPARKQWRCSNPSPLAGLLLQLVAKLGPVLWVALIGRRDTHKEPRERSRSNVSLTSTARKVGGQLTR
jgi:hypothetical protein